MTWLASWNYRKSITISNTGSLLSNYQVFVTVDTASLVTATKMRSDCGDIIFTSNDGSTIINYWIESGCNTSSTKIWIKMPSVATGNNIIYLYYGNSGAITTSNYADVFLYATGGNVTYSGNYTIHTFLTGGTFTPSFTGNVETLVVAGGGGGGYSGGGGAGGLLTSSSYNVTGPISVVVGTGGTGTSSVGNKGGNSSFGTIVTVGGGPGGNNNGAGNLDGGSGGGGAIGRPDAYRKGLASPVGQGNNGGDGDPDSYYYYGGGGGGAGGVGSSDPGHGGAGVSSNIIGTSLYYAGGGGGGAYTSYPIGSGGSSIGGVGAGYSNNGDNAVAYRGSGGGGSGLSGGIGGNGSSGIVIVRYIDHIIASPEPTLGTIGTEETYVTPANITATNMTITPSETPCRQGICTVTIVVRWSNSGGTNGTVIPNIKIDNVSQTAHGSRTVFAGNYIDETFIVSDLSTGTHIICPNPN